MAKYSKEQLWELYKELPEELKEAIFSEKTANNVYSNCKKNGLEDEEKISQISENVGYVLLGLIAPEEFKKILLKEVKLRKETAEKIYREIIRFVFFPLKKEIEGLYKIKIEVVPEPKDILSVKTPKKKSKKQDTYRELTE